MASRWRYLTEEEIVGLVKSGWDSNADSNAGGSSSDQEFILNMQLSFDNDFTG